MHLILLLAAIVALSLFSVFRLTTSEDISDLVPTRPEYLAEGFTVVKHAPFMRLIAITAGGEEKPAAYANMLAETLKSPLIPEAVAGPGGMLSPNFFEKLVPFAPHLLTVRQISEFPSLFTKEHIQKTIAENKKQLLGPAGMFARSVIALDPLRVHEFFLPNIADGGKFGKFGLEDGFFVDASGKYSLVLARPASSMTDSRGAMEVMRAVRESTASLPANVKTYIQGSYAHTEDNANIIKADLNKIMPVSFSILAILLIIFLRNKYALLVLCIPVISLIFSTAILSFAYSDVSGIVLAFGSVILGITADYAIHTYYGVTSNPVIDETLPRLARALQACALTTLSAFISLFFSDIPAMRQMAVFGASGILFALAVSIFVLPHFIRHRRKIPFSHKRPEPATFNSMKLGIISLALSGFITVSFTSMGVDGDIRNLVWKSDKTSEADEKTQSVWGLNQQPVFIVSRGKSGDAGMEQALHINGQVWEILQNEGIEASSIAPLLPPRQSQQERGEAWRNFWRERGLTVLAEMKNALSKAGFSSAASTPFVSLTTTEPEIILPETLRKMGMGFFLDMFVTSTPDFNLVFTSLPAGEKISQDIHAKLSAVGAWLFSGEEFRQKMAEAFGNEIRNFCCVTFLVTLGVVIVLFRSPRRCLPPLLPMLAALAATLLFFRLFNIPVNIFHAVALPLVIALSIDYGIFIQSALEQNAVKHAEKAILLSGLTTLSGFGCLLLARHPALHSIGIAVTVGVAAAMLTAVWLLPGLLQNEQA
ncbi:MAG: MMPL family transporter [Desulfovibrio sp.]|nr:MMPL family transporter [Desulfovibrio sp.]